MVIRRSKEKDRRAVLKLARACADDIGLKSKRAWLEEHIGTDRVLVSEGGTGLNGFCYAYMRAPGPSMHRPARGELHIAALAVDAGTRRQGVAKALVGELIRSNGHKSITCSVPEGNAAATALFTKSGFEVAGKTVKMCRVADRDVELNMVDVASVHNRPLEVKSYQVGEEDPGT